MSQKDCMQNKGCEKSVPGCGEDRDKLRRAYYKGPDLAVRCSRGQESVLASGHLWSWKQKQGKSDSNIFSEPVEKYYKDGKINFMITKL